MELSNIFKREGEEKPEVFWSLIIDKSWVEVGIWKVEHGEVIVFAKGISATWQEGDLESLVSAADSSMSSAVTGIPSDIEEPEKVVFGLHQTWLEEGDIKEDKLDILKKISEELELKPAGFVVINEALAHYLKSQEGAPASVLLTGLAEDTVDLTLVQNGKIVGAVEVGRSMSLAADLAEGLVKIPNLPQYPARILLYNSRVVDLEEARQGLLDTDWEKTGITFLHTPRVDILSEDTTIAAISLAGGAEIAQATRVRFEDSDGIKSTRVSFVTEGEGDPLKLAGEENETEESEGEDADLLQAEPQREALIVEEALEQAPVLVEKELEEVSPEDLGFAEGVFSAEPARVVPTKDEGFTETGQTQKIEGNSLSALKVMFGKFGFLNFGIGGTRGNRIAVVVGLLLLLIFLALGVAYWVLPKARVSVFVVPKRIEKTLEFSVSSDVEVADLEKKLIPGKVQDVSVTGEKSIQTTGIKAVGDKAKGKIIIYKSSRTGTVLSAGTVISGPNGFKFVLDNEQKVASGSGGARPSETEASVTAVMLGADYNLASGTVFTVGNLADTDIWAENKIAFSGGSSREIAAIADKDIANLESSLSLELLQKGVEDFKSKIPSTETLVESSVLLQKDAKSFSGKSGEEAVTLELKLEGKVTALVAPLEGVNRLVRASMEKEIPEGFLLKDDQIDISYKMADVETIKPTTPKKSTSAKDEDKTSAPKKYLVEVKANLLPKLNMELIASSIAGKYPEKAKEILKKIPGYTRTEIYQNVKILGRLGTLPWVSKNIVLEIRTEQ